MKDYIRKYFHPDHVDELESHLEELSTTEVQWIISDIQEANGTERNFQITKMKYSPKNKSIDLSMKEKYTGKKINRDLIL